MVCIAGGHHAYYPGRCIEINVDALRPILKKIPSIGIAGVIAGNECIECYMLNDIPRQSMGLSVVIAHAPSAAPIER
jgi:hypothetical protein